MAYQEFLRANGINPEDLSQKEYSDLLNTQDMYNDDLIHFSKSENCKDVGTYLKLFSRLGQLGRGLESGAPCHGSEGRSMVRSAVLAGHHEVAHPHLSLPAVGPCHEMLLWTGVNREAAHPLLLVILS